MRVSHLPPMVRPICDAPYRLNSDRAAIRETVEELTSVPNERLIYVMAAVNGSGIMFHRWWMRLGVWFIGKRFGYSRSYSWISFFVSFGKRYGNDRLFIMLREMQIDTIEHITKGKDHEDSNSVGGLSKRELQAMTNILAVSRRYEQCPLSTYEKAFMNEKNGAVL